MERVYSVAVFLLLDLIVAAHVPPPTNVKLHCRNLRNIVKWSYREPSPGLRFKVDFGSTNGLDTDRSPLWVDPPTLQADVSFLSDPEDDYYLTVTAAIGQNESESVPSDGIVFSYFQNSQAPQKCFLDLPPVNVTSGPDGKVLFRFTHPSAFYKQNLSARSNPKPQKSKRHDAAIPAIPEELPTFTYHVVIVNQTREDKPHERWCEQSVCEETLPVDAAEERHCLKITGELEKMLVKATQEYCAQPFKAADNTHIYILVGLSIGLASFVIIVMAYRKTIKASTPLPPSMTIKGHMKQSAALVRDTFIVPELEPSSPSLLLPEKEVDESTPADTPFTEYDVRLPIGVSTENDEQVCDVTEAGQQKDEYMQGTKLDEDESETVNPCEGHSSYEKRPVFVEIAPGEQAEGYRG